MVMSLDGKTTKEKKDKIYEWSSREDQKYFFSLLKKQKLVVMGRKTFMAARPVMKLSPKILRVVFTSHPEKYSSLSQAGQLEFTKESPLQLVQRLEKIGYKEMLLVGGSQINTSFLELHLIDEVWITIEPVIFGEGMNLFFPRAFHTKLKLKNIIRMNEQGTLLLKYKIFT
jgi:dihydrofolate reductase